VKKILLALYIAISSYDVQAQVGGTGSYSFLTVHPHARIAALGGVAIATPENDIGLAAQNPALMKAEMHNQLSFSHAFIFADIQTGYVAHARHYDKIGTFSAGLQYISYGNFQRTAANGEPLGTFSAGEYAWHIAYAKKLDEYFSIGSQVKLLYSSLAQFNSYGVAIDLGATYHNPEQLLTASITLNNYGRQLSTFNGESTEAFPANVQLGVAKKLQNAPFRFTITAKHLNRPGQLIYQNFNRPDTQRDLETGLPIERNYHLGHHLISHLNVSTEILFTKTFYVAAGYNYLRRWEMGLRDFAGGAGFSWGFGFRVKKLQLAYGRNAYFVGNATDHLAFIININDLKKQPK
jgi:hypothetical protein